MNIFITGISGFVGSLLARELKEHGHHVSGSSTDPEKAAELRQSGFNVIVYQLGEDFDEQQLADIDVFIHCAYDLSPNSYQKNIDAVTALARTVERSNCRQVFISSYSAHEKAVSDYGRSKWQLERYFLDRNQLVLRLGLVVGRGGMYDRLQKMMRRFPAIPLIDGGKGRLPILSDHDLVRATRQLIESKAAGSYELYYSELVSLRAFVNAIKEELKLRTLCIPLPLSLVVQGANIAGKIGIRLPINVDSLRAFEANQELPNSSQLAQLVDSPLDLRATIARCAQ